MALPEVEEKVARLSVVDVPVFVTTFAGASPASAMAFPVPLENAARFPETAVAALRTTVATGRVESWMALPEVEENVARLSDVEVPVLVTTAPDAIAESPMTLPDVSTKHARLLLTDVLGDPTNSFTCVIRVLPTSTAYSVRYLFVLVPMSMFASLTGTVTITFEGTGGWE